MHKSFFVSCAEIVSKYRQRPLCKSENRHKYKGLKPLVYTKHRNACFGNCAEYGIKSKQHYRAYRLHYNCRKPYCIYISDYLGFEFEASESDSYGMVMSEQQEKSQCH